MKGLRTPAQEYANSIIELIDKGNYEAVMALVMDRPLTLRNAMSNYLYKSVMDAERRRRKRYFR